MTLLLSVQFWKFNERSFELRFILAVKRQMWLWIFFIKSFHKPQNLSLEEASVYEILEHNNAEIR